MRWFLTLFIPLLLAACHLTAEELTTPSDDVAATPTISVLMAQDAADSMVGICFEAAQDAAGQVFVLRNAEEHIRFYDLADNSQLCRRPVERQAFDFETGKILVGLWSTGTGCTARHEVLSMTRDDASQSVTIALRFTTEGDCGYELVQPFWRSLDGVQEYDVRIIVET